jgi:hypothetical protein
MAVWDIIDFHFHLLVVYTPYMVSNELLAI